ncbi:MAG: threonine-phosphate decarboxylase, partial [Pseudomonadota bacterium]
MRDHGGNLDAAVALYGGVRGDWTDLSTGINPVPYPIPDIPSSAWAALPDQAALDRIVNAVRRFWQVPNGVGVLAAPGCSALIAQIPTLIPAGQVQIAQPTYNEHAAAFEYNGWSLCDMAGDASVIVHPNNPTGHYWDVVPNTTLTVIDESFCDIAPNRSHINRASRKGVIILKSFGKFWG